MLPTLIALAEPNRFRIVELLSKGPCTVGQIASHLQLRQPQASKHLRVLSDAGVVEVHRSAQQRIYRLRKEPFLAIDAWLKSYRDLKEKSYDRLEAYLETVQTQETKDESK